MKRTCVDANDHHQYDDDIEPTRSNLLTSSSPRRFPRSRARSRSRGYYSFSSDDVIFDDSSTLAYDAYVDMEHPDASWPMTVESDAQSSQAQTKPTHPDEGPQFGLQYLNMHGRNTVADRPVQIFSLSSTDNILLRIGELPYENLTYCSQLYGNVPDALACRNQLSLCTMI